MTKAYNQINELVLAVLVLLTVALDCSYFASCLVSIEPDSYQIEQEHQTAGKFSKESIGRGLNGVPLIAPESLLFSSTSGHLQAIPLNWLVQESPMFIEHPTQSRNRNININVLSNMNLAEIIRAYRGTPSTERQTSQDSMMNNQRRGLF